MSMSKFASQADYWKDRAAKAEKLLREVDEIGDPEDLGNLWTRIHFYVGTLPMPADIVEITKP